ncbi:hypothetical protein EJB05_13185, partial [Eragrostis curvula]
MLESRSTVVVDAVVYFLYNSMYFGDFYPHIDPDCIASFDLEREEWRDLPGPISSSLAMDEGEDMYQYISMWPRLTLSELKGSLVLSYYLRCQSDVWFLTDVESGLWVKEYSINTVSTTKGMIETHCIKPLVVLSDGRLVVHLIPTGLLLIYDPRTNNFDEVRTGYIDGVAMYTGSVLSLPNEERQIEPRSATAAAFGVALLHNRLGDMIKKPNKVNHRKASMKKTIVLYPGLFVSHFAPMMQLADFFVEEGYAVAVALIDITMDHDVALATAVGRIIASAKPSITVHRLPRIQDPPAITNDERMLLGYYETIRRYNEPLREFLCSLQPRTSIHTVVVDAPSVDALDVTRELRVPAYTFFATNASAVAVFLQLPWILRSEGRQPSFRELAEVDASLDIPGVPLMPVSHLMGQYLEDPESEMYKVMMGVTRRNPEPDGIVVNTVASLEPRAVAALGDPRLLPASVCKRTPPVYCVGPLVAAPGETKGEHECLAWLDKQPERSVVFLCFGILGEVCHTEEQLKEIALGLESSRHRFLWVVRAPISKELPESTHGNPDLDALLPDGFLERTKGRGLVVKMWAPQVEVLRHRATGLFVTHCGWNSAFEAITAGVPMICWPLYAEQKMNKVFMVEEARIGVEVVGWQQGLVSAEEVEAKVRLVMESEEGERLRARVAEHRDVAAVAWKRGGSSRAAFGQLLSDAGNLCPEQTLA